MKITETEYYTRVQQDNYERVQSGIKNLNTGRMYFGMIDGIPRKLQSVIFAQVFFDKLEDAYNSLQEMDKWKNFQFAYFPLFSTQVLPFLNKHPHINIFIRNGKEYKQLVEQFNALAGAYDMPIKKDAIIKELNRIHTEPLNPARYQSDTGPSEARELIFGSILASKTLQEAQKVLPLIPMSDYEKHRGNYLLVYYTRGLYFALNNQKDKSIEFLKKQEKLKIQPSYLGPLCSALIAYNHDDEKGFKKYLLKALDGYIIDCRSFADGHKDKPSELFCFDCLAAAKLGYFKGWEMKIEHEKFPGKFYNYIIQVN